MAFDLILLIVCVFTSFSYNFRPQGLELEEVCFYILQRVFFFSYVSSVYFVFVSIFVKTQETCFESFLLFP